MGIVENIDRLLQTLRAIPGPPPAVRDPLSGLPLTASEQPSLEEANGRPSASPPSDREPTAGADSEPARALPENPPAARPTPVTEEGLNGSRAREPHVTEKDTLPAPGEPLDPGAAAPDDPPGTARRPAPDGGLADVGEQDATRTEQPETVAEPVLSQEPDGPETPSAAAAPGRWMSDRLDADSLTRLEVTAGAAESLGLGYHLGGAVERIAFGASRGREGTEALREASWLIERYIALVEGRPVGADLHASAVRLGRSGDAIAEIRALTEAIDRLPTDIALSAPSLTPTLEPASPKTTAPGPSLPEPPVPDADAPPVDASRVAESPSAPDQPRERHESFGREVALMAIRWTIMVVAVIVVVLAVTLIGEWV